LLDIFNDRKRPFFQSALNYELKTLPDKHLVPFTIAQFKKGGKHISKENTARISQLVSNHPYYMQKFCFFLYEEIDKEVAQKDIVVINQVVMESERIVFESILQGLTTVNSPKTNYPMILFVDVILKQIFTMGKDFP